MPITLTNNGTGDSPPITSTTQLPPGVTAEMPTAASSGPASTTPQSFSASPTRVRAQEPGAPSVTCSRQTGLLTCTTDRGLRRGESMTFDYLVRVDESATGGEISVNISAGAQIDLPLPTVPAIVQPPQLPPAPEPPKPPEPVDRVDLRAYAADQPWPPYGRIAINVRNTGTSTRAAESVTKLPDEVELKAAPDGCTAVPAASGTTVTCAAELAPGEQMNHDLWVQHDDREHDHPWWPPFPQGSGHLHAIPVTVPITASLGEATDHHSVRLRLWLPWWPQPPHPPHEPPVPPTSETNTPPTTTTPSGPECPPWWLPVNGAAPLPTETADAGNGHGSGQQHGHDHWHIWQEWDGWHCRPSHPSTPGQAPATPSPPAPAEHDRTSTTMPRPTSSTPAQEPSTTGSTPPTSPPTTSQPPTTSSTPSTTTSNTRPRS